MSYFNYLEETPSLHSESDDFFVFNKPSSWSCSAPGSGTNNFPDWVSEYMKNKFDIEVLNSDWCNLLHKYNFETSGMILVGNDAHNLQNLKDEITWNGLTNKYYYALVNGILDEKKGDIIKPIKSQWPDCSVIDDDGEPAHSRYEVIKELDNRFSLVKVKLVTVGRIHQIRLHFKSIGHPLLSDSKYMENDYRELLESNLDIIPNFLLHNCRLDFKYKDKEYIFESPLPIIFELVLEKVSGSVIEEHFNVKNKLYDLLKILKSNNIDIEVLKNNNVYLLGESILRLFMGLPLDTDLDFYFVDDKSFKNVDEYFNNNFTFLSETSPFKSYKVGNLVVQLINNKKFMGVYGDIVSTFDFTISTGCFDFKNDKFRHLKSYFEDIENKRLIPNTDWNNKFPADLLHRIEKFKSLGFTIDDELVDEIKKRPVVDDECIGGLQSQRVIKKSWLKHKDVYPIIPNIDVLVNWLMDIKDHKYFDKFNYYLTGGFMSWPEKTKDVDIIITKREGQRATLKELEELMVDMFDSAYDIYGFFLNTFYMRTPQWIADYPRDREILKAVERKQLFITITKHKPPTYVVDFKRYGKLNCLYMGMWKKWWKEDDPSSLMIHRWVDLDSEYARWRDLRRIIKYYENNKERNIEDFLNEFQEYSGY